QSGPGVMPVGALAGVGRTNSVILPLEVMRPIRLPSASVNQSAPSGPAVMPRGLLPGVGRANSVTGPLWRGVGVARPVPREVLVGKGVQPARTAALPTPSTRSTNDTALPARSGRWALTAARVGEPLRLRPAAPGGRAPRF